MDLNIALSKFAKWEADSIMQHNDIDLWYAPSECHEIVHRSNIRKLTELEKELGISYDEAKKMLTERLGENVAYRTFHKLVNKYYINPFEEF